MEIYVALPTGRIISLEEVSNTIKCVKEKVKAKESISSDEQLLMVNRCEELSLTDNSILSNYSSHSNSTQLRLILRNIMLILTCALPGKIITLGLAIGVLIK